ncbi:MAG: hypothetical protein AAF744_04015 [Pseudomonadota bacterium]
MRIISPLTRVLPLILLACCAIAAQAATLSDFLGSYEGSAEFEIDGKMERRDMSATIAAKDDGFEVSWRSVIYKADGRIKDTSYTIDFLPSGRDGIYASAMKTNVFGKAEPLDPLKGEPFVWARFEGDTLTVFSLFINEVGGYEMQEYHRTLAEGGLELLFRRLNNGTPQREIRTFLARK